MSNGSTSKRRILVADDVPGTVEFLAEMLAQRGYEVATAEDGEQCLRQIREFEPDLVILDIMMPKVHGIDVLKAGARRRRRRRTSASSSAPPAASASTSRACATSARSTS